MIKYTFHSRFITAVLFTITASLLLTCSTAIAGKVYKWVDKNGKTHFSQTPPHAEVREYDVRFAAVKPAPLKEQDHAAKPKDDKKAESEKKERPKTPQERLAEIEKARAEQAKVAMEKAKVRDERIKKCQKAQANMRNVTQGGRIYEVQKNGEREYWDDQKRNDRKEEAQKMIDKYCE